MSSKTDAFELEFAKFISALEASLPISIDGKSAIVSMRDGGSRHWKQMEWIGFWFEFVVETDVLEVVAGHPGPKFGRTQIDLMLSAPWDLKAHPADIEDVILNDVTAVDECIEQFGVINYLLLKGDVTYDDELQTFKNWHDAIKGKPSRYVLAGSMQGRRSRRRKTSFTPREVLGIQLDQINLQRGEDLGWISRFQEGMVNANGKPRNAKYLLHLNRVDNELRKAHVVL